MPKFITKNMHAYLDYPVALLLIIAPFVLALGISNPLAKTLSVVVGVAALILTLLTDHKLGVLSVLSYKLHLTVDFLVGLVFVVTPFVMGFAGLDLVYYVFLGVTVLAVVGLHKPDPEESLAR